LIEFLDIPMIYGNHGNGVTDEFILLFEEGFEYSQSFLLWHMIMPLGCHEFS
jgi:hypothetical protein